MGCSINISVYLNDVEYKRYMLKRKDIHADVRSLVKRKIKEHGTPPGVGMVV